MVLSPGRALAVCIAPDAANTGNRYVIVAATAVVVRQTWECAIPWRPVPSRICPVPEPPDPAQSRTTDQLAFPLLPSVARLQRIEKISTNW